MKNLKWIRLVPDQPGKGGIKSGIHSFQAMSLNDIRTVSGFHIYRGAWRRDFDANNFAFPGIIDDGWVNSTPLSAQAYIYPSLSDPSASANLTLIGHSLASGPPDVRYWDFTNGGLREHHAPPCVPATFININGRCFAFDGAREGIIFDDRTPAIHAQANQNLGIADPQMSLGYVNTSFVGMPNLTPWAMAYTKNGSVFVTSPDPNCGIKNCVTTDRVTLQFPQTGGGPAGYYGGVIMAAGQPIANGKSSNTAVFTVSGTISVVSGSQVMTLSGAGIWPATGDYCGCSLNVGGQSFVIASYRDHEATVYDINGNIYNMKPQEVVVQGTWTGPNQSGLTYTVTGAILKMPAAGTLVYNNAGVLGYSQSTASNLCRVFAYAQLAGGGGADRYIGNLSWGTNLGPRYAYAWYDPETGHISNLSRIYQIPNVGPVTQNNVTPAFNIDLGTIDYPVGVDATRFSHVLFFRTLTGGGSTFFPIGSLQPYVGKTTAGTRGSWNPKWMGLPNEYCQAPPSNIASNGWYDISSDADLLVTGGLIGPQYTNAKPLVTLKGGAVATGYPYAAAYWDQRLWLVNTQQPDTIMFSCDSVQCSFGIPEESFPSTNFLRVPSQDGTVRGMKLVGEMVLITTDRWAYTISGNNESNYRLVRISARMSGVGTHQMDDFPSDVEGQSSVVYFIGRDRMIYEWIVGGQATVISREIQDQLDTALGSSVSAYTSSRIHCVSSTGRRFVMLSLVGGQGAALPYGPFVFDVTARTWTHNPIVDASATFLQQTPYHFGTVYGRTPPVTEFALFLSNTLNPTLRTFNRDDISTTASFVPALIRTFPITFDGKKSKKSLFVVNVHCSSPVGWTCTVIVDESTSKVYTSALAAYGATAATDAVYSLYGPVPSPVDRISTDLVPAASWSDISTLCAAFGTSDNSPPTGYRFDIQVSTISNRDVTRIFAIDIGYLDDGDGGIDP